MRKVVPTKIILLIAILFLASYLRFVGIYPGYSPYHSDEGMSYAQGIYIVIDKSLDAEGYAVRFGYPNLVPLINAVLFKYIFIPVSWVLYYLRNIGQIVDGLVKIFPSALEVNRILRVEILGEREVNVLTWGRTIVAFFGVGVVFLTYIYSKKVFGFVTALCASFLLAVNYREVLNSHLDLPDIYNAFFLMLSLLVCYFLSKKQSMKNYLLAGVTAALFFSTKYQIYGFLAFGLTHLIYSKRIFSKKIFIAGLISLASILVINPYHFIHIESTLSQLTDEALKYGTGSMSFDGFSFSYLYHIGIGKLISISVLLGIIFMLRKLRVFAVLFSVVFAFFFITTYYTGGGFYTRNFVTITPLLLIFAGYFWAQGYSLLKKILRNKLLASILIGMSLVIVSCQNIQNSLVVASEYSKQWNYKILSSWLEKNIPAGAIIGAHPFVQLPVENVERVEQQVDGNFSLEEMQKLGAQYVVLNFDLVSNEYYWWMTVRGIKSLNFWNKPTTVLSDGFAAMAAQEYAQFNIFSILNPWQAPDSDFLVARLPRSEYQTKDLISEFDFQAGPQGWTPKGALPSDNTNQRFEKGALYLDREGALSNFLRWDSSPIDVGKSTAISVQAQIQTKSATGRPDGFIVAKLYPSLEDARNNTNRGSVYLSARNTENDKVTDHYINFYLQSSDKYLVISFQTSNPAQIEAKLLNAKVYNSVVSQDEQSDIKRIQIDPNLLFLESHGGL